MRSTRHITSVFTVALTLLVTCPPLRGQVTQTQEVYEQAISAVFREDVDVSYPRVVYVFKSSDTLNRLPDSSYQGLRPDRRSPRPRWGDVPRQLRDLFHEHLRRRYSLVAQSLPPDARWREDGDDKGIVLGVSSVAFASDTGEALVYVAVHCGPICGGGDIVYLRKTQSGHWAVAATFPMWRS